MRRAARSASACWRSPSGVSAQTAVAGMPASLKTRAMKLRVLDADAEAERAHPREIVDAAAQLLHHLPRPGVVRREQVRQALDVVAAAAAPGDLAQIEAVVDAVVDERRRAVLVDGVPEPQLGGDPVVEPVEQAGRRCAPAWP